ncbi:uncharacterized protein LOC108628238 isoform X2 [Ceratina calcarata]|uniref:Uncharacterized protein LOC108628238 isoform X2 n=1 Tax=Ceratina calcarata TaxID=156304 RepID=A0AAJ7S773_9HYME|nr:uncharacterized protein LOC108628238 isoform X2 [Ceratina calcarata]
MSILRQKVQCAKQDRQALMEVNQIKTYDNLSKPCSALSRSRFPEVYLNIRRLEEGLIHDNYTHIMSILNGVRNEEQSSFTKATYQILCNQIKYSPYKLTKIATTAVQTGGTATFYEILAEVTILTLANLAKEKLWVLAYRLMKDFRIIFESKMEMYKLNAATVLLFAEIYLENKKAFDAFTLVKRTNIIYSNRHRWKVQSVKDDSSTRVEIIKLLLNTFCETHPHHGLALFDLIAEDQSKNFIPIGKKFVFALDYIM